MLFNIQKLKSVFYHFVIMKEEKRNREVNLLIEFPQVYPDTAFDMSSGEGALEIFISDLNDKEDMIDNFISNLEYEQNDTKKKRGFSWT